MKAVTNRLKICLMLTVLTAFLPIHAAANSQELETELLLQFLLTSAQGKASGTVPSAVSGSYLPIKEQLLRLSEASLLNHQADEDLPRHRLFVAVGVQDTDNPENLQAVRDQLALLLTGPKWKYLWHTIGGDKATEAKARNQFQKKQYHLARQLVTDEERKNARIKSGMARLKYLKDLVKNWPAGREALIDDDRDLLGSLDASFFRGGISLLGSLPEDTVKQALAGGTLEIPVSSLSAMQQVYLDQYVGKNLDPTVGVHAQGTLKLAPRTLPNGSPDISLLTYTTDPNDTRGGRVLNTPVYPELEPVRERAAKRREFVANKVLAKVAKVDKVTIPWDIPTESSTEPPLSAYLRTFASQTGLTILGRWPDPDAQTSDAQGKAAARLYRRRLSESISNRPLAEALNTLCRVYGTTWVMEAPDEETAAEERKEQGAKSVRPGSSLNKEEEPKVGRVIRFWADTPVPSPVKPR